MEMQKTVRVSYVKGSCLNLVFYNMPFNVFKQHSCMSTFYFYFKSILNQPCLSM